MGASVNSEEYPQLQEIFCEHLPVRTKETKPDSYVGTMVIRLGEQNGVDRWVYFCRECEKGLIRLFAKQCKALGLIEYQVNPADRYDEAVEEFRAASKKSWEETGRFLAMDTE